MYRRGFTIVELIIVITIMGILLIVGVANLRGSQANARDDQRNSDVQAIAANLEKFYNTGNSDIPVPAGTYPSILTTNKSNVGIQAALRDIDPKSLVAPGISDTTYKSFISATCSGACVQTTAGVTPQPTINTFVYQPLLQNGSLCTSAALGCQKFNIYYALENTTTACPTPNNICMVTSKNQ
jgi:prepilin-type N-terminal cleavage/methylation domain-containing protein